MVEQADCTSRRSASRMAFGNVILELGANTVWPESTAGSASNENGSKLEGIKKAIGKETTKTKTCKKNKRE